MTDKPMGCVNCGADDHDTKDCTRLPVAGWEVSMPDEPELGTWLSEEAESEPQIQHHVALCYMADAQALIAELRETLAAAQRVTAAVIDERDELRAQLQAAPAERGVVLPEPMARGDEGGSGEYGAAMIRGFNACLREVARLNPAPATAEPAGCTKPGCFPYCDCDSVDAAPATADSDVREVRNHE